MKILLLAFVLVASPLCAADRLWQHGTWRDQRPAGDPATMYNIPIGTQSFSFPLVSTAEFLVIEGADGMLYTAKTNSHRKGIIVNDPVEFAIDGEKLVVRREDGSTWKMALVSRARTRPNESAAR